MPKNKKFKVLEIGGHTWDTAVELRTKCELTYNLMGKMIYNAPLAYAVIDGNENELQVIIKVDKLIEILEKDKNIKIVNLN